MKFFMFPSRSVARRLGLLLVIGMLLAMHSLHAEPPSWYPYAINEDALSGVADFSAMNHALGSSDRMFARNGHFYRVGADGKANTADDSRIRLFGISLTKAANFPAEQDAPRIARRLRKLGFNAVRLHHLDTDLSDSAEPPRGILTSAAFPTFNESAMQRLRTFIDALKQEGLYVNLNLHVGYTFRPAVDGITPLAPGEKMPYASHPLHLFEPRMIALQVEYAQQLLRRLALNNDPALAMLEINNESSLLGAWQRGELDSLSGEYERLLQLQWQRWIARHLGATEKVCRLWHSCGMTKQGGLLVKSAEALALDGGAGWGASTQRLARRALNKLGIGLPSVLEPQFQPDIRGMQGAGRRVLDFTRFLAEMDKQYLETLRKAIRAEVGELVPLSGTQMYMGGVLNADAQQAMDYVDEHFYVDHYDFPHQAWDRNDWRIRDQSALREAWSSLLQLAYFRDVKKPFVISEFNQAYPNRQGAEILPVMVAVASAQDWDGLFFYHYIDGDSWQALPDSFGLSGHGGQLVTAGIAAAMFRQFQIRPLPEPMTVPLTPELRQMLGAAHDAAGSSYAAYLKMRHGLEPQHVFFRRSGVLHLMQENLSANALQLAGSPPPFPSTVWSAGGGQLQYNPDGPWLQVSTPYSRMFAGTQSEAHDTEEMLNPVFAADSRHFGVLLLSSRDGLPLKTARRVLLALSGATSGNQPDARPPRPKQLQPYPGQPGWWTLEPDTAAQLKPSGPRDASAPVWLERIPVSLFYPAKARKLTVYPLDGEGRRQAALPAAQVVSAPKGFQLQLNQAGSLLTPWYELVLE